MAGLTIGPLAQKKFSFLARLYCFDPVLSSFWDRVVGSLVECQENDLHEMYINQTSPTLEISVESSECHYPYLRAIFKTCFEICTTGSFQPSGFCSPQMARPKRPMENETLMSKIFPREEA